MKLENIAVTEKSDVRQPVPDSQNLEVARVSDSDMWRMLDDYLDTHSGDFEEGVVEKIRERLEVVDDPERPGQLVFDVERHRGWLGATYKPGQPMGSFVTYWQRYCFDPSAKTLESLGVVRPSEFTAGVCEDPFVLNCSFTVERLGNNRFQVSESCTQSVVTVADLAEAERFVTELVEELNLEGEVVSLKDALAPGQEAECEAQIREAMEEELINQLHSAWKHQR